MYTDMAPTYLYAKQYAIYNTDSLNLNREHVEALVGEISHITSDENQEFSNTQIYYNVDQNNNNLTHAHSCTLTPTHVHTNIHTHTHTHVTNTRMTMPH